MAGANLLPRGLFDRDGNDATGVWVHDSGDWVAAEVVFSRDGGTFVPIWARVLTIATNLDATLADPVATITWDSPADDYEIAQYWDVYRENGTLVGTLAATGPSSSYSLDDASPLGGVQTWTVKARIGTYLGTGAVTPSVIVGTDAQDFTATPDYPTSTSFQVILTWNDLGPIDYIRIYRPDGSLVGEVAGGVETITDTTPVAGYDDSYRADVYSTEVPDVIDAVVESNTLRIGMPVTGPVSTVQVIGATLGDTTWSVANVGHHTGIRVDGTWTGRFNASVELAPGSTFYDYSVEEGSFIDGTGVTYSVRPMVNASAGFAVVSNPCVYKPPSAPSVVWNFVTGSSGSYVHHFTVTPGAGFTSYIATSAGTLGGGGGTRTVASSSVAIGSTCLTATSYALGCGAYRASSATVGCNG